MHEPELLKASAAADDASILQANGLGKQVELGDSTLTILQNVSFSLPRYSSLAIVGASGSGKSTLLGLLAGLDVPSMGDVTLNGATLSALDEDGRAALRAASVGFVFQSFQLLPALSALDNVALPLELQGVPPAMAIDRATVMLQRVGLGQRLGHFPRQLSGGEQQRVAIARAFVPLPRLLFADEPTGNLDSRTGEQIIDLLFELNQDHQSTLVLVTHDERLARRCQYRLRLEAGEVVEQALP